MSLKDICFQGTCSQLTPLSAPTCELLHSTGSFSSSSRSTRTIVYHFENTLEKAIARNPRSPFSSLASGFLRNTRRRMFHRHSPLNRLSNQHATSYTVSVGRPIGLILLHFTSGTENSVHRWPKKKRGTTTALQESHVPPRKTLCATATGVHFESLRSRVGRKCSLVICAKDRPKTAFPRCRTFGQSVHPTHLVLMCSSIKQGTKNSPKCEKKRNENYRPPTAIQNHSNHQVEMIEQRIFRLYVMRHDRF